MIFQFKRTVPKPFARASVKSEEHRSAKGPCIFSGSGVSMSNQTCYTIITLSLGSWLMQCYSSVAGFTHELMLAIMWRFIIFVYIFCFVSPGLSF